MKEFYMSIFDKYTHFITIDWNNLLSSLGHNLLIMLISVIALFLLLFLIGVFDDFDNPFLYIIGKIFSIPLVLAIIIFELLFVISLIIATIILILLILFILFKILILFFPLINI